MRRPPEERLGRCRLHLLARVHDDDAIADLVRGAEVVRREEHGHAALLHELAQQPQDLRLDGHVERRGGLVGDDQVRSRQERHGDHEALALAAGKLVRQPSERARRLRDLRRAQDVEHRLAIGPVARAGIALQQRGPARPAVAAFTAGRLPLHQVHELGAHGEHGVERAERVLRNEGDGPSTHPVVEDVGGLSQQIAALEHDLAGVHARRASGEHAENRPRQRGLPAAALPHEADHLAGSDVEADSVEHARGAAIGREAHLEPADREQL